MEIRIFQKGFNYSQDGPGNRLVYHLQGCNMRCPWCANPEGMSLSGGTSVDVESVLDEVERSRSMFFDGGGVTLSGGEPTVQMEAVEYLLTEMHKRGIHTAIETNASHPRFTELLPLLDYVMMDLKQPFSAAHRCITGVELSRVVGNIRYACQHHPHTLVHIPFVNGYNTAPEDMTAFATLLESFCDEGVQVEILRYHEYGRDKWMKLGFPYTVQNGFVTEAQTQAFIMLLQSHGIRVIKT